MICNRCGYNNFKIEFVQTRALDEAPTKSFICERCEEVKREIKPVDWRPKKNLSFRIGYFLVSELAEPLIQQELDSLRVRKTRKIQENTVTQTLKNDETHRMTYCFHIEEKNEIKNYWKKLRQIKLIDIIKELVFINTNEIIINKKIVEKYQLNKNFLYIHNIKDLYKMVVKEGIDIPKPNVISFDDYRIPKAIKSLVCPNKYKTVTIFKGNFMDILKELRISCICDSIPSLLLYHGITLTENYITKLLEDFLPHEESALIARTLLEKCRYNGIYKGIEFFELNNSPLQSLLKNRIEKTLMDLVENQTIDYLISDISKLMIGQHILY